LARADPVAGAAVAAVSAVAAAALALSRGDEPAIAAGGQAPGEAPAAPLPFPAVLDALPEPVMLIVGQEPDDLTDRRFVYANPAARELFRIARSAGPLATAVRAPEVLEAVDEALFGQAPGTAPYASGGAQDRVWMAVTRPLARDSEAGPRLAVLMLRDETDARRAERTRADFLANASHELRTPLASLTGFIETLRGHAREDAAARDRFLGIMQVQAERMRRLIEDLMSLSRIELNEHVPPSGKVDLALASVDVIDALAPLADERGVTIQPTVPARGEALVVGDRDQLLQVIQNLTENALKYSPAGSTVGLEIRAGVSAAEAAALRNPAAAQMSLLTPDHAAGLRYVALSVRDAGPGIAREHLPRLTERFYRVEGQKSGERQGTGLGLAIVKHIVNRHRGGLVVESQEGAGAMFTAYVPMLEAAAPPPPPPPSALTV
ncbi:MAG TPA: ATP-binding protein, partial [Caulobacteraceae bacterium]|nr:ATP-binding protein [Caulobacteraceae bacterium]